MCDGHLNSAGAAWSAPRAAEGPAADPVTLPEADEVTVTTLSGPAFEPVIAPTVAALTELTPGLIAPGHCTGWRAQHALAAALPDAWVQTSVGTTYTLSTALPRGQRRFKSSARGGLAVLCANASRPPLAFPAWRAKGRLAPGSG